MPLSKMDLLGVQQELFYKDNTLYPAVDNYVNVINEICNTLTLIQTICHALMLYSNVNML